MRISGKTFFLFPVHACPGSCVVCCCSNHKKTFSALSIAVSGSLSYPLVGEAACALNPSSAGNLLLQVWLLPSESVPTPALWTGLQFSFASCLLGSPASLTCTSALTEPPAFPLPQGKVGLRRSKYLGTNKAEVLASCL